MNGNGTPEELSEYRIELSFTIFQLSNDPTMTETKAHLKASKSIDFILNN